MVEDFLVATCKTQCLQRKEIWGNGQKGIVVDGGMFELLMLSNGRANIFLNLWQYQP
jgi:hypothetical protein